MARKPLDERTKKRGIAFGKLVREERERKKLSQEDLARSANIRVATLQSLEQAKIKVPGLFIAADIVRVLDGDLDEWALAAPSYQGKGGSGRWRKK